jgi:hypothetical protein
MQKLYFWEKLMPMTITVELKSESVLALLLDLERLDLLKLVTAQKMPTVKNVSKGKPAKPSSPETPNGQPKPHPHSVAAKGNPDLVAHLEMVSHEGIMLPITPATEAPDIKALVGIWKDKDITLEKLRRDAWGDRL